MKTKPFTVTLTVNYHTHAESAQLAMDSARTNLPSAFDIIDDEVKDTAGEGIREDFSPTKGDWDLFQTNNKVNVFPKYHADEFESQFVATVIDKNATHIIVENEEGESFTVDPDQIFFNTDEYMH